MLRHITHDYPWWNQTNGADHIVPFLHDEGACYAPKEFAAATLLVHWGRRDVNPESCTAFQVHSFGDRERDENFKGCEVKRADMLAGSPPGRGACYRRGVDIVIPPWTPRGATRRGAFILVSVWSIRLMTPCFFLQFQV